MKAKLSHNTVVSCGYAPPFANLALVQSAGGLIRRMRHFLSQLRPPSIEKCLALLWMLAVDAGFVLALPLHNGDLETDCVEVLTRGGGGVGGKREARDGEMLRTLAVGWQASALRGEEAGRFTK